MNSSTLLLPDTAIETSSTPRHFRLRAGCWAVALALGAAQAWATRFSMNPDGVSYLDIGDAYWRHDWHNAISAYWSPLYSWILGFFINVIKPSLYWEYPLVHFVNFLIYVAALGCFEFLLTRVLLHVASDEMRRLWKWCYCLGFSFFLTASLVMIGLHFVSPDMLVAAFVYLIIAFMIEVQKSSLQNSPWFGIVLGTGYLAKTILLPFALLVITVVGYKLRRQPKHLLILLLSFTCVAAPYVAVCSTAKHRPTIGESARWNYLVFINGVDPIFPSGIHTRRIVEHPTTYDFRDTVVGTYPPWRDPSYWQDGIQPKWNHAGLVRRLKAGLIVYAGCLVSPYLNANLLVGFFIFALLGAELRLHTDLLLLITPSVAILGAYLPLLVELRYIAPFLCTLWLIVFLRFSVLSPIGARISILLLITTGLVTLGIHSSHLIKNTGISRSFVDVAGRLKDCGLTSHDKIALISTETWMETAAVASYAARLLRVQINSELTEPDLFWKEPPNVRSKILLTLKNTGVRGVLLLGAPPDRDNRWVHLDDSDYYYLSF